MILLEFLVAAIVIVLTWMYIAITAIVSGFFTVVSVIACRSIRRTARRRKHTWV